MIQIKGRIICILNGNDSIEEIRDTLAAEKRTNNDSSTEYVIVSYQTKKYNLLKEWPYGDLLYILICMFSPAYRNV